MFAISPAQAASLVAAAICLTACGASPTPAAQEADAADASADAAVDAAADATTDIATADAPFEVADHPPAPQVVKGKGSVLSHPHARVVTFDGDPQRAIAEQFVSDISGSPYWAAATAEYGVGDLIVDPPIHLALTATATIEDTYVETFLADQLTHETALWGAPDAQTIYVLVYPVGVTITEPQVNGQSCTDFGAYHAIVDVGGVRVPYAAVPACPGFDGPKTDLAHVFMGAASHELLEAATDPDSNASPGWYKVDPDHAGWATIAGGPEIGDLCTFAEMDPYQWPNKDYTSERAWSNSAALAGHDPCQPTSSTDPYFNAAPETPDKVKVDGVKVAGVHIAAGADAVVPVHLFSDAPRGEWTVYATDYATWYLQSAPQLQFDWDGETTAQGKNGDVRNLHITVLKADAKKYEPYFIFSKSQSTTHVWMGFVGN